MTEMNGAYCSSRPVRISASSQGIKVGSSMFFSFLMYILYFFQMLFFFLMYILYFFQLLFFLFGQ